MRFTQYWNIRRQGYDAADAKRILSGRKPKSEPGQKPPAGADAGQKARNGESAKSDAAKKEAEPKIKRVEWGGGTGGKEAAVPKGEADEDKKGAQEDKATEERAEDKEDGEKKEGVEEMMPEAEPAP